MGALANAASLAQNTTFQTEALAALIYQARNVITEDPATANHSERINYAKAVITDPARFLTSVAWVMACDPTIAGLGSTPSVVPEATLLAEVLASWDTLAGLFSDAVV